MLKIQSKFDWWWDIEWNKKSNHFFLCFFFHVLICFNHTEEEEEEEEEGKYFVEFKYTNSAIFSKLIRLCLFFLSFIALHPTICRQQKKKRRNKHHNHKCIAFCQILFTSFKFNKNKINKWESNQTINCFPFLSVVKHLWLFRIPFTTFQFNALRHFYRQNQIIIQKFCKSSMWILELLSSLS